MSCLKVQTMDNWESEPLNSGYCKVNIVEALTSKSNVIGFLKKGFVVSPFSDELMFIDNGEKKFWHTRNQTTL